MTQSTDRIEKQIVLRAPRERVWKALTTAKEFGKWFGWAVQGEFAEGKTLRGAVVHKGYEHLTIELTVERVQPEELFSYRWHPHAIDPEHDYSGEPTTLVVFQLREHASGTLLIVTESGFDGIPLARREQALRSNSEGWAEQLKNIERYLG